MLPSEGAGVVPFNRSDTTSEEWDQLCEALFSLLSVLTGTTEPDMDPDSSVDTVDKMTLIIALATQVYMTPADPQPSDTNLTLCGDLGF